MGGKGAGRRQVRGNEGKAKGGNSVGRGGGARNENSVTGCTLSAQMCVGEACLFASFGRGKKFAELLIHDTRRKRATIRSKDIAGPERRRQESCA